AILAQVQVPCERFFGKLMLMDALQQQFAVRNTLAAADDFAVAFRRQYVHSQSQLWTLWIWSHVERLDGRRIAMHHHRLRELLADQRFVRAAEVAAPLNLATLALQDLDRFIISDAREGCGNSLELGDVALQDLQLRTTVVQNALDDEKQEAL